MDTSQQDTSDEKRATSVKEKWQKKDFFMKEKDWCVGKKKGMLKEREREREWGSVTKTTKNVYPSFSFWPSDRKEQKSDPPTDRVSLFLFFLFSLPFIHLSLSLLVLNETTLKWIEAEHKNNDRERERKRKKEPIILVIHGREKIVTWSQEGNRHPFNNTSFSFSFLFLPFPSSSFSFLETIDWLLPHFLFFLFSLENFYSTTQTHYYIFSTFQSCILSFPS